MKIPTDPTAGGRAPPFPPNSTPKSDVLKDVVGKVSKATGGSSQQSPPTVSFPTTAVTATPLTPDPGKAAATVKQSVKREMELETLLKMAPEVRDIILTGLSDKELNAFEIALCKGITLQDSDKIAFQKLKSQISQNQKKRILQEILADHPAWKSEVEVWKGISLEDKIWLLQLYELRNLGVEIPQIIKKSDSEFIPSQLTPELLKSDVKTGIVTALNAVTKLHWSGKQLKKCPRAICLLGNLEELYLSNNELTAPPNVSKNVKLKELFLRNSKLITPPNVSKNVNLRSLHLPVNQLKVPPDVSKNVNLQILVLNQNELKVTPDVTKNVNLELLDLYRNELTTSPDVSKNVKLKEVALNANQLTAPPDVSKNVNLTTLFLTENQLKTPPDVSKNVNLTMLYLNCNQLTSEAKQALEKLKIERINLRIED